MRYHLIEIAVPLIVLYVISWILSRKHVINLSVHRKIWNVLLLLSFLVSGILGLLLVIRMNGRIVLPHWVLKWHVEIGIVALVVVIFHVSWHWRYFRHILFHHWRDSVHLKKEER
jgi:hypothetical protein